MTIQVKVTRERFEEVVSIDDEMYFGELTRKEVYDYMLQFVWGVYETVNKESGTKIQIEGYLPVCDARKLFKKIPSKDLSEYVTSFFKAINEAFVNPTKGAASEEQS